MNRQILEEIKNVKQEILPEGKVILFGSQARGDEREDSDWDLLVLIDKSESMMEDYNKYGYPFTEKGFKYGVYISPKIYTKEEWEKRRPTPFYKNVERDGIEIV
ncbi:MAG: nucleotidyltransferase domain-containing protein [Tannerella sp.]|jgi:predicted nucleotidyltransferase|nr:nucleotidyltransferase domain-containing protein [Tannerella sp.]